AERRVREPEAGVERVAAIVRERQRAGPALALLRLVAVRVVEATLHRVASLDFREADRDVVGRIDVEISGKRHVGWRIVRVRIADAVAPRERWCHAKPVPSQMGGFTELSALNA